MRSTLQKMSVFSQTNEKYIGPVVPIGPPVGHSPPVSPTGTQPPGIPQSDIVTSGFRGGAGGAPPPFEIPKRVFKRDPPKTFAPVALAVTAAPPLSTNPGSAPDSPWYPAVLTHADGSAGVLTSGQDHPRSNVSILQQLESHKPVVRGRLGILQDLGELLRKT